MSDKILIPFSGGVNSTYSLYRWLTESDAEVIARHGIDDFQDDDHNAQELERVENITNFLKKEYRDFNFQTSEFTTKYIEERIPIRPGFKKGEYNIGVLRPRYLEFTEWCIENSVNAISIGVSIENTATQGYDVMRKESGIEDIGVDIYLAGTPDLIPVPTGDDFKYDEIAKDMIGRFEQYEALPEKLQPLCLKCNLSTCSDKKCRDCAYQRTYEMFISGTNFTSSNSF